MGISYEWRFENIEVSTASDPEDAAEVLHWRLIATDDADGISSNVYGSVTLGPPDPDDFVAFDDITNANCVAWVVGGMGEEMSEDKLKAALAAQIIAQRNPPRVSKRPSGWS